MAQSNQQQGESSEEGAEGRHTWEHNLWTQPAVAQAAAPLTKISQDSQNREDSYTSKFPSYLESDLTVNCPFILSLKYLFIGSNNFHFLLILITQDKAPQLICFNMLSTLQFGQSSTHFTTG